ncbi:hypothetical protein [Fodinicola acaciae]|uniref:hypothetical protein n=1 Tax=Fodinicola acaciae TaxID=2681555 RepID=UPI0013D3F328|nr:hypothetical protein [Fodinicola acaciae]
MSTDLHFPQVEQFSITVDSADTVRAVLEAFETDADASAAFSEVLECYPTDSLFILPLLHRIQLEDFEPWNTDLPSVGKYPDRGSRLFELEKLGILTDVRTEWYETSNDTYLSDGRALTIVRVPQTVIPVEVRYTMPDYIKPSGWTYASSWRITEQLDPVPAGWYLIGEEGDYRMRTVGVSCLGNVNGISDDFGCHAAEVEGFLASHCMAECDTCGMRWAAESGSWHFVPDWGYDAAPWDFDDADGFDVDDCITCPHCSTGRVGFLIS